MEKVDAEKDACMKGLEDLTKVLLAAPGPGVSSSHDGELQLTVADEELAMQHVQVLKGMLQVQLQPPRSLTRPKALQVVKNVLKNGGALNMLEIGGGVALIVYGTMATGPAMIVPLVMGTLMIVDGVSHIAHLTFDELMQDAHEVIQDEHVRKALMHKKHHRPPKSLHALEGAGVFVKA